MTPNERDDMTPPSALEREIAQQGHLLEHVRAARREDVEALLERIASPGTRRWAVTGAGDSLFAGMCAQYWFAQAAGLPLDAHHALAYSRYLYRASDEDSVVFAVSYSGTTVRVVEAARAAKSRGATVIAITANGDSPLVELADAWLPNDAVDERSNTRTMSFQVTALLLRIVTDVVAERLGAPGLPSLEGIGAAVDALVASSAAEVSAAVDALPEQLTWIVVGGGCGHPTGAYGAAKLYEAATLTAHSAELEQFIHCEIFPVTGASAIVLLAPRGASHARAVELADGLRELGARTIGVSDNPAFAAHTEHFVALPDGWAESEIPFLGVVPLQWLALRLAERRGENPDLVANKAVNRPLIESPLQWESADYTARGGRPVSRA
jgi:glutamine---fructose-6-phosphate transaminase (isomerizing)